MPINATPYSWSLITPAELAEMTAHYLEAAQWADAPDGSRARFTKQARAQAERDCLTFANACPSLMRDALSRDGYSVAQFGHDFWLTRQGHGAGYWDRPTLDAGSLGAALTGWAQTMGGATLSAYRGWLNFD